MISRRKLNKLLGKEVEYTAVYQKNCKDRNRALLLNVEHKGKQYADHVWVTPNPTLINREPGERIKFRGVAYMYNDRLNRRKQGLTKCVNFERYPEEYEDLREESDKHALARISRKYY